MPSLYRLLIGASTVVVLLAAILAALTWVQSSSNEARRKADIATGGVGRRAIPIMMDNGCAGCHTITGVPGARGLVGPPLDAGLATRVYVGGVVPNDPANLIRWIRAAREINPHTAMPSTGITEQQARDVAAYLYSLQ
jgi:mono/diheme cytochrome c family protein